MKIAILIIGLFFFSCSSFLRTDVDAEFAKYNTNDTLFVNENGIKLLIVEKNMPERRIMFVKVQQWNFSDKYWIKEWRSYKQLEKYLVR